MYKWGAGTHTGHTGKHGHTDHTDEPHSLDYNVPSRLPPVSYRTRRVYAYRGPPGRVILLIIMWRWAKPTLRPYTHISIFLRRTN